MNLGLRRMIVMCVRSVVRSGCRRAPRGRGWCPAAGIGGLCSRTLRRRRFVILYRFHLRHRDRMRRVIVARQRDFRWGGRCDYAS